MDIDEKELEEFKNKIAVKEEAREKCENRTDHQNCELHDWID